MCSHNFGQNQMLPLGNTMIILVPSILLSYSGASWNGHHATKHVLIIRLIYICVGVLYIGGVPVV